MLWSDLKPILGVRGQQKRTIDTGRGVVFLQAKTAVVVLLCVLRRSSKRFTDPVLTAARE